MEAGDGARLTYEVVVTERVQEALREARTREVFLSRTMFGTVGIAVALEALICFAFGSLVPALAVPVAAVIIVVMNRRSVAATAARLYPVGSVFRAAYGEYDVVLEHGGRRWVQPYVGLGRPRLDTGTVAFAARSGRPIGLVLPDDLWPHHARDLMERAGSRRGPVDLAGFGRFTVVPGTPGRLARAEYVRRRAFDRGLLTVVVYAAAVGLVFIAIGDLALVLVPILVLADVATVLVNRAALARAYPVGSEVGIRTTGAGLEVASQLGTTQWLYADLDDLWVRPHAVVVRDAHRHSCFYALPAEPFGEADLARIRGGIAAAHPA